MCVVNGVPILFTLQLTLNTCVQIQGDDDAQQQKNRNNQRNKSASSRSAASDTSSQKYYALEVGTCTHCLHRHRGYLYMYLCAEQAIKKIEVQISDLESEKRVGKREIDDIELDIRCKRQEIADIRRKYLNYFYYF